ncbi:embryogenesis-like protein [Musa acuminata AAA Group]|uniref:embryogenesis-like protein n=1 Tax=Musa acuminata AAA Group TaxID=214697 RepID=UPI0031DBC450
MRRSARFLLHKSISAFSSLPAILTKPPTPVPPGLPFSSFRLMRCPLPPSLGRHGFATGGGPLDHSKEVDEINLKFAEAREEIEAAMESKETIYFDEEAECAREAVKTVLDMFEGLLARLPEKERMALQRSMGLKIEQLKAELKQLDD